MKEVEVNKQAKLSEHFSLGEMTKTSYHPQDGNIPSRGFISRTSLISVRTGWRNLGAGIICSTVRGG